MEGLLPKDNENISLESIKPVAPSEPQGFTPDQMVRCEECLRANPPTRVTCLYCSEPLPLTEVSAQLRKPNLRPPDKGQLGYNNIFLSQIQSNINEEVLNQASDLLKLLPETLQRILSAQKRLPLARTASREEALLVLERLRDLGLETITLSDDDLGQPGKRVTRIRSIHLNETGMLLQQSGATEGNDIGWSELKLLVLGRLLTRRIEIRERKTRKDENEILNSSEFFDDEAVMDLYTTSDFQTWRISAKSFDFSCLEHQKTLLTAENFATLVQLIRSNSVQAEFDDSYNAVRQLLEHVWGSEQETESSGWRRESPGKYSLGATTVDSNENQFTRYSRLRYYLSMNSLNQSR